MAVTRQIANQIAGEKTHSSLNQRNLWFMVGGYTFFNLFVRWYEEVYGWSAAIEADDAKVEKEILAMLGVAS